jgi:hypothetical protein
MSAVEQNFSEKELWEKFSMLTEEMNKFLDKDDIDTFLELLSQRIYFEKMILQTKETAFIKSEEGQNLLKQMIAINKVLSQKGQLWLNKTRNNRNMSRAYESLGYNNTGFSWDRQF